MKSFFSVFSSAVKILLIFIFDFFSEFTLRLSGVAFSLEGDLNIYAKVLNFLFFSDDKFIFFSELFAFNVRLGEGERAMNG